GALDPAGTYREGSERRRIHQRRDVHHEVLRHHGGPQDDCAETQRGEAAPPDRPFRFGGYCESSLTAFFGSASTSFCISPSAMRYTPRQTSARESSRFTSMTMVASVKATLTASRRPPRPPRP